MKRSLGHTGVTRRTGGVREGVSRMAVGAGGRAGVRECCVELGEVQAIHPKPPSNQVMYTTTKYLKQSLLHLDTPLYLIRPHTHYDNYVLNTNPTKLLTTTHEINYLTSGMRKTWIKRNV